MADVKFRPALDDKEECGWLEDNLKRCLREKSLRDKVPKMNCKVENLLWFFLECPTKTALYENKESLRQIFIQDRLKETDPKAAILKKK